MSSLHNSYFQLFLEDLISLKEELLFDLNTDAANDEKIERFELASKTECDLNGNLFVANHYALKDLNSVSSVHSSPSKSSQWTWECRSLDDLAMLSRKGSFRSQFALTLCDQNLSSSCRSLEILEQKLPRPNYLDQELINTSLLIKPLCLKSGTGICTTGFENVCTKCVFMTAEKHPNLKLRQKQYIGINHGVNSNIGVSSCVVRDTDFCRSVTCLPTYLETQTNLAAFPGDRKHTEQLIATKVETSLRRRNAVPSVKIDPMDLFDYDSDSDKLSDILEDDLERGSAVLAAFVVAFITISFFGTLVAMISVTMSVSGDYQGRVIAFNLCKQFSAWSDLELNESSWCENKIFNYHFDTAVHCKCFMPFSTTNFTKNSFTLPPFQLN